MGKLTDKRNSLLWDVVRDIVRLNSKGVPNFADSSSKQSSRISCELLKLLGNTPGVSEITAQSSGKAFEEKIEGFVRDCFEELSGIRPGDWKVGRNQFISNFDQYDHLNSLVAATRDNPELAAILGRDYVIKPDIVMLREPLEDADINSSKELVDAETALRTPLRKINNEKPLLHASISCKWTIRSDRSQNSRTEALNLIRNRKGRLPHIVVVTAEPTPNRIASIALGTGDIDCVYHFALYELREAIDACGFEDALELLDSMIDGRRLRDISDLPLDLAV